MGSLLEMRTLRITPRLTESVSVFLQNSLVIQRDINACKKKKKFELQPQGPCTSAPAYPAVPRQEH